MKDETFREKVYGPYLETWKILKLLQFAGEGGFSAEQVKDYWEAVEYFTTKYDGNEFAQFMKDNVLLHADNVIVKLNEGGAYAEVQSAQERK